MNLDAAPLALDAGMTPFVTTDGFTVQPLEFPGGDIGSLAVNGTVNDLAVSGADAALSDAQCHHRGRAGDSPSSTASCEAWRRPLAAPG